ncbi:MAG: hypothetical protein Q8Q02_00405 [Nocardioides sp.]|nr:hypothetical protein [Nocardioides sp.]
MPSPSSIVQRTSNHGSRPGGVTNLHDPGDILTLESAEPDDIEGYPIATAPIPQRGVE